LFDNNYGYFFILISVVEIKNSTISSIAFYILQFYMSNFIHASFCTVFKKMFTDSKPTDMRFSCRT